MLQQRLAAIEANRAKAPPLPSGVAPFVSSQFFKLEKSFDNHNLQTWDQFWSDEARVRTPSTLKGASTFLDGSPLDLINLDIGRPFSSFFPWKEFKLCTVDDAALKVSDKGNNTSHQYADEDFDFKDALNYGYSAGSPQLLRFITEHVQLLHNPPYHDWECSLTSSTTYALDSIFRMFCNRGDWILTEEYSYSAALEAMRPLGIRVHGIKMDEEGLVPEDLDYQLQNWTLAYGHKPSLLYTIPTGQNPTGTTQPEARRKAIYRIAQQHNLLIVEDDPYYFLQMEPQKTENKISSSTTTSAMSTAESHLQLLPPSYLSMDNEGRVIRLDSSSKILAPGLRCGWITACSQIIGKFKSFVEMSTVAPCALAQIAMYELLDVQWGHAGFLSWTCALSQEYRRRRDIVVQTCQRYLPAKCQWNIPKAGMFVFIHIDCAELLDGIICTQKRAKELHDLEDIIYIRTKAKGVIICKGSWFSAGNNIKDAMLYDSQIAFRLTFAAAPREALAIAVERFAGVVHEIVA